MYVWCRIILTLRRVIRFSFKFCFENVALKYIFIFIYYHLTKDIDSCYLFLFLDILENVYIISCIIILGLSKTEYNYFFGTVYNLFKEINVSKNQCKVGGRKTIIINKKHFLNNYHLFVRTYFSSYPFIRADFHLIMLPHNDNIM